MQFPVNLLLAGVIIVIAWILNLSVICAMRSLNSGSHVVYAFLNSLCVANLFLATIDFPPPIISKILVSRSMQHVMCVSWTYLDTILCNVIILHLLGCSLDSYLRLRHPSRYVDSTKQLFTCLKLSAPWTLSFVQSTAFMAIAQIAESTINDGVCSISDPNFLILRSVMCFGFPISISSVLVFLSAKSLSKFNRKRHLSNGTKRTKEEPTPNEAEAFQLLSTNINIINRDETQETIVRTTDDQIHLPSSSTFDCNNSLEFYQHQCPQHGILAIPIDRSVLAYPVSPGSPKYDQLLNNNNSRDILYQCCSTQTIVKDPLNFTENCYPQNFICSTPNQQHCPDVVPTIQSSADVSLQNTLPNDSELRSLNLHQSRSLGDILDTHSRYCTFPASQSLDLQRISENSIIPEMYSISCRMNKHAQSTKPPLSRIKSHERTTIAINLSLCIISILFWGPFIIGSLIQGVCKPPFCILPISNPRLNEFKWLSYILCIIYPLVILIIDADIRGVIKSSLNC